MASRPMLQTFSQRVADRYGTLEDLEGEDGLLGRVASGETIKAIVADFGVSRGMLYNWLKAGGERRQEKFKMARTLSADAMADDALEILDMLENRPNLSNAEVSAATSRANFRKWLASVRNRAEYAEREKAGVSLNVSIRQLHLDALRAAGHRPLPTLKTGDAEIREAEVVNESPAPKAIPARSTD